MPRLKVLVVLAATLAAFAASATYYIILGDLYAQLRGLDPGALGAAPDWWQVVAQLGRNLVVAFVLARLIARVGIVDWKGAVGLGLWVWVGFQAMQTLGAVIHEGYPPALYALHVGDALFATVVMAFIIGRWGGR